MNVKIYDLMAKRVITAEPHHSVEHVRGLFKKNKISAVPVVGPEGHALGIVTSTDLMDDLKAGAAVSQLMGDGVKSVPAYNDVSVAARVMRKNKIHHVVVTHEKKVVGMLSSFDLLRLVEDHRFSVTGGPTESKKKRKKDEKSAKKDEKKGAAKAKKPKKPKKEETRAS